MKKFCSECGHPLEISKKFCSDCGTLNPYFSISHEIPSARSGAIDTLRARKESIKRELEEIEREQAEALRKEKFRIEMEELEKQRMARLEKEREIKERFEREGIEASLKKELQQVKNETEQYKEQTTELLKELRSVVYQIDQENRKLKEEVEQIAKVHVAPPIVYQEAVIHTPAAEQEEQLQSEMPVAFAEEEILVQTELAEESTGNSWIMGVVILLLMLAGGLFAYFYYNYQSNAAEVSSEKTATVQADVPADVATPAESATDEAVVTEANTEPTDNPVVENNSVIESAPSYTEPAKPAPKVAPKQKAEDISPAVSEPKPKAGFSLTIVQAKVDLVGKKLAGCGIVLNSASEVESISNPVIVEDATASGYVKYKLNVTVMQGGDTYHVTPYLYYTPAGKFIRVDATNCE